MADRTEEFRAKYQRPEGKGGSFTFRNGEASKPGKPEYKAFGTERQRQNSLWVRTNNANSETDFSLPYPFHKKMITDGGGYHISIFVSDDSIVQIEIQGRNLGPSKGEPNPESNDGMQDLWRKLLRWEVIWIQEFDPRIWETPADGAPVITGIKVHHKLLAEKPEDERLPGELKVAGTTRNRH
jgi:hypothetical protein